MRRILMLCALVACKTNPVIPLAADAGAGTAASVASVVVDAAPPRPKPPTARDVADAWNAAHVKHDAHALEGLYAIKVQFYGQTLSNKQCAAKKGAAFEKSTDYTQSIKDLQIAQTGSATTISFTKTSTEKGKSTDYPAVLVVVGSAITAETDKVTEANLAARASSDASWCLDAETHYPNDVVKAPYKLSAGEAYRRARFSKHFKEQEAAQKQSEFIDFGQFSCPTQCNAAARECRYDMRLEDHSRAALTNPEPHSILIEWMYVDAATAILYWDDGKSSEPLPPMPVF